MPRSPACCYGTSFSRRCSSRRIINPTRSARWCSAQRLRLRLQAIDVLYFDLASSLALPIATVDRGLRSAARAHGVALVTPA
jgi:hypothetical protein